MRSARGILSVRPTIRENMPSQLFHRLGGVKSFGYEEKGRERKEERKTNDEKHGWTGVDDLLAIVSVISNI